MFPNIDRIGDVRTPVFIMHGTDDQIVPLWHAQGLQRKVPARYKTKPAWVRRAGHNNLELLLHTDKLLTPLLKDFLRTARSFQSTLEDEEGTEEEKELAVLQSKHAHFSTSPLYEMT
eukprot:scaffold2224_cov261-Pinguiococcus_pyrenoidosus.AAC.18